MKSVISTITVLTVFSLAIVSSVSAQNSREKEIEAMKKDLTAAGIEQIEVEKAIRNEVENAIRETAAENARMAEKMKIEKLFLDLNAQSVRLQEQRVRGRVLVVPTADTKAGDFASIMQDMNIMTHIFDKKLNYSSRLNDGATIVLGGLLSSNRGKHFISGDDKATKAMYVGGYGAVFFIKVNFPLSPPEELKVKIFEEGVDPVWEDAKQDIYALREGGSMILASPDNIPFDEDVLSLYGPMRVSTEYDTEKVDELKRKLIKTLKHAANIRSLNPQDRVVLVVRGTPQPVVTTEIRVTQNNEVGKAMVVTPRILKATSASLSSLVLTIRAKKSDIDAFSKGELDFDKFHERTQILTSRAKLGGEKRSKVNLNLTDSFSVQ
ncbi:MAG: hypothetical protein ACYS30_07030 [Planctomycetota bacterium]|jgi:hypothetical protein